MNVFDKAIEVLEEKGWVQKHSQTDEGMCLMGAISYVQCYDAYAWTDVDYSWNFLIGMVGSLPTTWNDEPERTYEDVILLLKRASEKYELRKENFT
jgi:hypothetical protein